MSQILQVNKLWHHLYDFMARSKIDSRSHHDVAHLHPPTNVYTLQFLRYRPDKLFPQPTNPPAHPDTMGENNTTTAHKGCAVNIKANNPTKYQLPTPYGLQDIAQTRFYRSRSRLQGQGSNQGHTTMLHTYTPNQCPYQVSTSYTLRFPKYSPDKTL